MADHGTLNGYRHHNEYRTVPCDACLSAQREYRNFTRFKSGKQHYPAYCRECGSVFKEQHRCAMAAR
jgi:uncharacterized Zn finger protein